MPIVNRTDILTTGFDEDALISLRAHEVIQNHANVTTTGDLGDGVVVFADGALVDNKDTIETSGDGASAIFVVGDRAHVTNFGSAITHGGLFENAFIATAISVIGDDFDISNRGLIATTGYYSDGIDVFGSGGRVSNSGRMQLADNGSGYGVYAAGDGNTLINSGAISSSGPFATGLFAFGADNLLLNQGLITLAGDTCFGLIDTEGSGGGDHVRMVNAGRIEITSFLAFGMLAEGFDDDLVNTGEVICTGDAARGIYLQDHSSLDNTGLVQVEGQFSFGVLSLFDGLNITNHGEIHAAGERANGIAVGAFGVTSDGSSITNDGAVSVSGDGGFGLSLAGTNGLIVNNGVVDISGGVSPDAGLGPRAATAVAINGDGIRIVNGQGGELVVHDADAVAVALNGTRSFYTPTASDQNVLVNQGLISAPGVAVRGDLGHETVINSGRIEGDVDLGGGDDTYVAGLGGALAGRLILGAGDDTVVVQRHAGHLVIADFTPGAGSDDVLDVSALGFHSLTGVLAASKQVGGDVVIGLGKGDDVVLQGVSLASLKADDFLFG